MDRGTGEDAGWTGALPLLCTETSRVHAYAERIVADVPLDARWVQVFVQVRRLKCSAVQCARQRFREQVPSVLDRYQRRTPRLSGQVGAVVWELAGRASVRALAALAIGVSRHTAVRILLGLPLSVVRVPRVLGVDDFALAKRRWYATILIDAGTRERIDVLTDRQADTLEAWLREHPGIEVMWAHRS